MAESFSSSSVLTQSRYRGPNLSDSSRFVRVSQVPIIDTLERTYFKKGKNGKAVRVRESVDEDQLDVILENSRLRADRGKYSILSLGHTDDDGPETSQPHFCGYISNFEKGEYEGRPTILADIFIDRKDCDPSATLRQFPRRSAEVMNLEKPDGYIDIVSLLKRVPERDLGLVTHQFSKKDNVSRFVCPDDHDDLMEIARFALEDWEKSGKVPTGRRKEALGEMARRGGTENERDMAKRALSD